MELPPLSDWGAEDVLSVVSASEALGLERKASCKLDPEGNRKETKEELAKQVCAFSNSTRGFLVYGCKDEKVGGGLDDGAPEILVGRESAKSWVEARVPELLTPPVHGCQARHIHVPDYHAPGRGVLVVEVPLSPSRPHWVKIDNRDVPFIRAGEHSSPMGLQTFLDISSRGPTALGEILGLGKIGGPERIGTEEWRYVLNPLVQVVSGPACELWGFELSVPKGQGVFRVSAGFNASVIEDHAIRFRAYMPLFPRWPTPVCTVNVEFHGRGGAVIRATLCVGSAQPVEKRFSEHELLLLT
jgi:hypothetical protein